MTVLTETAWLRKLVEDDAVTEYETSTASGTETIFYVANPPITAGSETVRVNGVHKSSPADYSASTSAINFTTAPAANATIEIEYTRQTFSDDELETFLAAAAESWDYTRNRVYQAAIYAIDSLLVGAATALNFGVGQENFDMVSVFNRLKSLRDAYEEFLQNDAEAVNGETGAPALVIQDMYFDLYDPAAPDPPILPDGLK